MSRRQQGRGRDKPGSNARADGQRKAQPQNGARRRSQNRRAVPEPVLIAARRPNSPLYVKARASASAAPKSKRDSLPPRASDQLEVESEKLAAAPLPKRVARIVKPTESSVDQRERERERLLARLLGSEGRAAVTRAATDYRSQNFEYPREQAVQLKLLEHLDEEVIREAISNLSALLAVEPVLKRPVLEQRLKRLEDTAEDEATRASASELRRGLRN